MCAGQVLTTDPVRDQRPGNSAVRSWGGGRAQRYPDPVHAAFAYADADLKGKPVVNVWGFLRTRMSSLEHDAAARHRHPGLQRGRHHPDDARRVAPAVATPSRILICYDEPKDDTLSTIKANPERVEGLNLEFVRNPCAGAMRPVMSGFVASRGAVRAGVSRRRRFQRRASSMQWSQRAAGYRRRMRQRFIPAAAWRAVDGQAVLVRTAASRFHVARLPTRGRDEWVPPVFHGG